MSWFKPKVNRVTLDAVGYPDLFVEFKKMDSLTYKQTKDLQAKVGTTVKEGEDVDDESGMDSMKVLFTELVTNWNLPSEDGTNTLPLPSVAPEILDELPLEILSFVASSLSGDQQIVPKEIGN